MNTFTRTGHFTNTAVSSDAWHSFLYAQRSFAPAIAPAAESINCGPVEQDKLGGMNLQSLPWTFSRGLRQLKSGLPVSSRAAPALAIAVSGDKIMSTCQKMEILAFQGLAMKLDWMIT